ncbi:putative Beta-hexosaminidase subunit B2 [Blattamonas nauphoetae]|uniref:beta-N-acetylhexosaminidase n=1 Tax=Blattamonas nauphoetae TaxID=2049346 RepID=A0ABQ9Y5Z7_9EUKA|nr:putative Beta-hexosaminidase subunit B2 [Blattamonas nauphoetae]
MVDTCRHFFPISSLKRIIDGMALTKINRFHMHLSDDQGFRIQSFKYPTLNSISSFRDNGKYGGYYTQAELKAFVQYASTRGITVIPEIDLPAHSHAILSAFPQYVCTNLEDAAQHPPVGDVQTFWKNSNHTFCSRDESRAFIKSILDEVIPLFNGPFFHTGGDEMPLEYWAKCQDCWSKVSDVGLNNLEHHQAWFHGDIGKHLKTKGKRQILWQDANGKAGDQNFELQRFADSTVLTMQWVDPMLGLSNASTGLDTIMTPWDFLYLSTPDDDEGLRWERIYTFDPLTGTCTDDGEGYQGDKKCTPTGSSNSDLHQMQQTRHSRTERSPKSSDPFITHPLPSPHNTSPHSHTIQSTPNLDEAKIAKHVVGVQATVWTEHCEDSDNLEVLLFPRLAAVSEIGWLPTAKKDKTSFKTRMLTHLSPHYTALGLHLSGPAGGFHWKDDYSCEHTNTFVPTPDPPATQVTKIEWEMNEDGSSVTLVLVGLNIPTNGEILVVLDESVPLPFKGSSGTRSAPLTVPIGTAGLASNKTYTPTFVFAQSAPLPYSSFSININSTSSDPPGPSGPDDPTDPIDPKKPAGFGKMWAWLGPVIGVITVLAVVGVVVAVVLIRKKKHSAGSNSAEMAPDGGD